MNEIQIFKKEEFGEIRVIMFDGQPWWILKDVCITLGLSNPTIVAGRLDSDEVTKFNLGGLSGETNIVNESGLYNVVLRSDKPVAKSFKRWITHEVLPSIRKHGMYATPSTVEAMLADPDTMILTLQALKAEREKRHEAEKKIEEQKPKVIFADAVTTSHTTILIGELAKLLKQNGIETGQNRLFQWLRDNGYLIKRKGTDFNMPTQYSMELGLFEIKESSSIRPDGSIIINKTTKVTGKGQVYFINLFHKQ